MKVAHLGEDELIALLTHGMPRGKDVRMGIGDDCAVIGAARDVRWSLLKTDVVIEGIHFGAEENRRLVGWKALCRPLSDIAAMGGVPAHALVTLAVSRQTEIAAIKSLYAGLRRAAQRFDVTIVGGETSRSPGPLFLSVAVTGWVERVRCVTRHGGRPGDALYVTGWLGGSRAGKHLSFTPRLAEARWLVSHFKLRAMMDLSDGLASDLPRLAAASKCSFRIDESRLPRTPDCTLRHALADGEDYELLFAIATQKSAALERAWKKQFPKLPLTRIGALVHKSRFKTLNQRVRGFDHFA